MNETDPFNSGRILSGRVHVKDIKFNFSIWGHRTLSQDEALKIYQSWKNEQRTLKGRKNTNIDVAWNG